MIGKTISHYKIISKIGEGGRGIVYKAEDLDLKRIVALKFISPHLANNKEELDSLYREAQSASKLNHPNITTIYEIGHSGKHHFITMEYLDGETLKDKIRRDSIGLDECIDIAINTLNGLKEAHESNIIHRDIKSENVMLTSSGTTKVMDFGLARSLERENVTRVNVTLGTIAYMSPEQIEGSKVDQRSDLYSFGVILYEMVTGRLPFVSEHEAATLYSIVNEPPPDILEQAPDANHHLAAIIEKALEKNPDDRYQNCNELLNDLEELKGGSLKSKFRKKHSTTGWLSYLLNGKRLFATIASVIVLLSLIFFIFKFFTKSSQLVDSIAVLNFENMNQPDDSDRLGQILQELIIADLSDITDLKVFSSQRLFDIQKQLGSENRSSIDPNLATDIARRAGAEALLTGKIIQRDNGLMLTSQLININDGSVLKSYQVDGNDIYQMVDNLTGLIQTDIRIAEEESDALADAVSDKTSTSVNAFQYYFNGVDYFNKSHFREAIVEFQNAIAIDSTFSSAYYKLAMAQWWSQSEMNPETIEDAQESLQKVLNGQWYKTTKEKLLTQGALELTRQNFTEAENLYQQLIDFIDDEKEAWYGLGEAYFHGKQDFDLAKDAFERAVELDPAFTVAYRHIFDIYAMNDEYDSGIIRATQLIDINPENAWGYIFLSNMLIGKREYEQAKDVLEDAIELDHELATIYHSFSKVYSELEQYDEGIAFINELSNVNDFSGKYEFLARMYIGKRQFENAIDIYERALAIYPDNYHIMLMIGHTYQLDGRYQLALNHCERIRNEYPNLWEIKGRQLLITVYNELGRYSDTIEILEEMMNDIPEDQVALKSDMLNNLAYYHDLVGNSEKSEQYLNESIASTNSVEEHLISHLIRSFILSRNNDLAGLLELKNTVTDTLNNESINPDLRIIEHAVTFNYYFTSRDYAKAVNEFNLMDPENQITKRFYYLAGLAYFERGDFDAVIELSNKMREISLSFGIRAYLYPRSFLLSGLSSEAKGNVDAARNDYQRQLEIWQDGDKNALDYQIVLQRYNSL